MEVQQPLVSVLVPCYNHEDYIGETIESVLQQTYPHVELLVMDDGSTDRSPAIIEALAGEHGFYFERQSNQGIHNTLNSLLGKSRGKYISVLGSDDLFTADKIAIQVAFMEKHPDVAASFGNMIQIDTNGKALPRYYQRSTKSREYTFRDILSMSAQYLYAPTAMYRKSVIDEVGGYDKRFLIEDLYMHLKMAYHGHRIVVLEDVLAYYRVHAGNMSKRYLLNKVEKLKLLQQYKGKGGYTKGIVKTHVVYWMYTLLNILPRALNPFKS